MRYGMPALARLSPTWPASLRSMSWKSVTNVGVEAQRPTKPMPIASTTRAPISRNRREPSMLRIVPRNGTGESAMRVAALLDVHHGPVRFGELVAQLDEQLERDRGFLARRHHLVQLHGLAAQV